MATIFMLFFRMWILPAFGMFATDALFGFRKVFTSNYPVLGAQVSASPNTLNLDLKNILQKETLARLLIRVSGNIVIAGAGAGVATGRDNPEAILVNCNLKTNPTLGVIAVNNLTARGLRTMNIFERGYGIKATTVADAAGTTAVDFSFTLNFKMPGSINPVEYALPLAMFESALLQLTFGGREQLFTGGTNTWDLSGLTIQLWADYDTGIAGQFHVMEFFERAFTITGAQTDFPLNTLEPGYVYTHFLYREEIANALVATLLNSITMQSAGRVWLPQGDVNRAEIQRWNRESHLSDPAIVQTGLTFIPALRDGMYTRAVDALDSRLDIKLDVNNPGGGTQQIVLVGRRIIPLGLNAVGAKAVGQ